MAITSRMLGFSVLLIVNNFKNTFLNEKGNFAALMYCFTLAEYPPVSMHRVDNLHLPMNILCTIRFSKSSLQAIWPKTIINSGRAYLLLDLTSFNIDILVLQVLFGILNIIDYQKIPQTSFSRRFATRIVAFQLYI